MPELHLPAALAPYAGGSRRLAVTLAPGRDTVAGLLDAVAADHPGVGHRVRDERGELRRHVNVFVNGESIRYLSGIETPVDDTDEVWILPAVSGG
jgi:sulfur-carrier protein